MKMTKGRIQSLQKAWAAKEKLKNWFLVDLKYKINGKTYELMVKVSIDNDMTILKIWEPTRKTMEARIGEAVFSVEYPSDSEIAAAVKRDWKRQQRRQKHFSCLLNQRQRLNVD